MLKTLNKTVVDNISKIGVFRQHYDNTIEILETSNQPEDLQKVIIVNIPNNVWIFENEFGQLKHYVLEDGNIKDKGNALMFAGSKVEKTILLKSDDRLYLFMIELKTSLTRKNIRELKDKFEQSLISISIYLASTPIFNNFDIENLFPVGVCMFNNNYQEDSYINPKSLESEIWRKFNDNCISKNKYNYLIDIKPITLKPYKIPVIFRQNEDIKNNTNINSSMFSVNFLDLLQIAENEQYNAAIVQ